MDLSKYYSSICKYPNISTAEERELFKAYNDPSTSETEKDRIKSSIINSNLRFAFKQAKYHSKGDPSLFAVLIPAANEGLVVGFEKYDLNQPYKYMTYAGEWVFQRIMKEMASMRVVSVPIWKQQLSTRIRKAVDQDEHITFAQLCEKFPEVKTKDLKELFQTQYLTFYIDDFEEDDFQQEDTLTLIERKLDDEKVWKAVAALPSPHREVIAKIFGLEDGEEHSISKLCKSLKIPKDTLRKIQAEGLTMLKNEFD